MIPAVPPPEPEGEGCLTHARIQPLLDQLGTGVADPGAARLVSALCQKRVYLVPDGARFVFWDTPSGLHGKVTTSVCAPPTEACIVRALAWVDELVPFGAGILAREAQNQPALWRDPDVGAVSFLECDAREQPTFKSLDTMLHETNHRISPDRCIYDYATATDVCFELDRALPGGTIAAYPGPPAGLDDDTRAWFEHMQKVYLEDDGQGIRELLDEVMAYAISSEMMAVGTARGVYSRERDGGYNNLTIMMAFVMRYLNELARRDPALAAAQFGKASPNRASLDAVIARGEGAYQVWVAVVAPGSFERVFWDEYLRGRAQWAASAP